MALIHVSAKPGWILERLAREVVEGIPDAVYVDKPTEHGARITYFLPAFDISKKPDTPGLRVGLFTHGEDRVRQALKGNRWDACVAMNRNIGAILADAGAPNMRVIRPGVEEPERRPRFGVCGHFHNGNRKGAPLIEKAIQAGFDIVACGNPREQELSIPITYPTAERSKFYQAIDYLLVTPRDEGGPMTVPEALANRVPVIAPEVGWCWEFPVIRYERTWDGLRGVLMALSAPPSWRTWRQEHRGLFEQLLAQEATA